MTNDILRAGLYAEDPLLRNAFPLGHWLNGAPAFLDLELQKLPALIQGPTKSGKSSLLHRLVRWHCVRQSPYVAEYLRRLGLPQPEPVSIIYANFVEGRDDREANIIKECARLGGMEFKACIPTVGRWSHVDNPLRQSFFDKLSGADRGLYVAQGLGMLGNQQYGQKYFGGKNTSLLVAAFQSGRDEDLKSFWHLNRFMRSKRGRRLMKLTDNDSAKGDEIYDHLRILSTVYPLVAEPTPVTGIDLAEPFLKPQLIFFNLDWQVPSVGHMIAKLALFGLAKAAQVLRNKRRRHVLFVCDEAQHLVMAEEVMNLMNQIRHRDLSVILAHQFSEQLIQGDVDLSKGADANSAWTVMFGLSTPDAVEKMQKYAPDDLRPFLSYEVPPVFFSDPRDPRSIDIRQAIAHGRTITAREDWQPRYGKNEVITLNMQNNVAWLRVRHNEGLTRLHGIAPFRWQHSMSLAEWNYHGSYEFTLPKEETVEVLDKFTFATPREQVVIRDLSPRAARVIRSPEQ